jgi:hypothetical protein
LQRCKSFATSSASDNNQWFSSTQHVADCRHEAIHCFLLVDIALCSGPEDALGKQSFVVGRSDEDLELVATRPQALNEFQAAAPLQRDVNQRQVRPPLVSRGDCLARRLR